MKPYKIMKFSCGSPCFCFTDPELSTEQYLGGTVLWERRRKLRIPTQPVPLSPLGYLDTDICCGRESVKFKIKDPF